LQRAWQSILQALPPINNYHIKSAPEDLDDIIRDRAEAQESARYRLKTIVSFGDGLDIPHHEIDEYEARLIQMRRDLVRDDLIRLMAIVDPCWWSCSNECHPIVIKSPIAAGIDSSNSFGRSTAKRVPWCPVEHGGVTCVGIFRSRKALTCMTSPDTIGPQCVPSYKLTCIPN
jgi:hypothetical protein